MDMRVTGTAALTAWFSETADRWGTDVAYLVGTNVEYADDQEFGTSSHSGTPHLRPAADKTQARMAQFATQADDIEEFVRLAAYYLEAETKTLAPVDTGNLRASYSAERVR